MPAVAPYGAWRSPVSAELVAAGGVSLDEVRVAGDHVYWIEGRPLEGGRQVVCRARPGGRGGPGDRQGGPPENRETEDLVPEGFNARTRVHEYGGGAYSTDGRALTFSNFADQRLYRLEIGSGRPPRPITPEPPAPAAHRYADACPTPDGRRLVCVRERHEDGQVVNELVALAAGGGGEGGQPVVLAAGRDFYATPGSAPTAAGWPGWSGTTRTCPGTAPSCGWPTWPPTGWPATRSPWPAGQGSRCSSPSGARTGPCTWSATAAAGGTCTGSELAGCWRRSARPRRSSATPSGSSPWRPTPSCPAAGSPASTAAGRCSAWGSSSPTAPCTTWNCPSPPSPRPSSTPSATGWPAWPAAPPGPGPWSWSTRPPARPSCCAPARTTTSTPATSACPSRSSSPPRAAAPPTPSTTRRPTPRSRDRRGSGHRWSWPATGAPRPG